MTTTKKKLNRADYMFVGKTGEELLKKPGDVNGLDFAIRDLTDCKVFLLDTTAQVNTLFISTICFLFFTTFTFAMMIPIIIKHFSIDTDR